MICECGRGEASRQGKCLACWGEQRRVYVFSDELVSKLRIAYGSRKAEKTSRLNELIRQTRWPRSVFHREARRLGLVGSTGRKAWSKRDNDTLSFNLGDHSIEQIARMLGRSPISVRARAEVLELSRRIREGYSSTEFASAMGVTLKQVSQWIEQGLLKPDLPGNHGHRRISESRARGFITRHADKYDLRKVDQLWFRTIAFTSTKRLVATL